MISISCVWKKWEFGGVDACREFKSPATVQRAWHYGYTSYIANPQSSLVINKHLDIQNTGYDTEA